jgi:hypothetical protein
MKKLILSSVVFILQCLIGVGTVFAEGKPEPALNKVVRTEGLSGLNLFLAQTYNNNRLLFSIITTGTIVVLGIIVTWIIGFIIKPSPHRSK